MTATVAAASPARRLGTGTMGAYAFGAVAYGVKDSGFGTFLLLFYNQVVGLPSQTVGLVVMLALVVDAFIDPAVGFSSDRTRGRWGRRHPWMYASALPIAIGWLLLWNPPALSQPMTLLWLFGSAVIVRTAVSCYEVPSVALTPELTADYDERTRIMAWRYLFGWAGGLAMLVSAYLVFLLPAPAQASRAGFSAFAVAGMLAMVAAILVSAIGTHRQIPTLPVAPARAATLRASFAELAETVRNRGFAILMLAGICAYTNQGISYALSNYLYAYVWGLGGTGLVYVTLALFSGVFLAFVIAPRIGRRFDKRHAAAGAVGLAVAFHIAPYCLRLAGLFPPAGSAGLLPAFLSLQLVATASSVSSFILGASMMADIVEDSEQHTGRRSEGVFFAGSFFVQKCTTGLGIFLAGTILEMAGFPEAARPGSVPVATIDRLTMLYVASYLTLGALAALLFTRFPFGRKEHEARLARLTGAAKPVVAQA